MASGLFSSGAASSEAFIAGSYGPAPPAARPRQSSPKTKRNRPRRPRGDRAPIGFRNWVAYLVMFLILPASAIFTMLAVIEVRRAGSSAPEPRSAPSAQPGAAPATLGDAIAIVSVAKAASSDEFTLEYRLERAFNQASQFFWIVSSSQGRIEFPIPGNAWQASGKLSGKPAANLPPPYTSYIEEQTGATRTRVSNEVPVTVGG